MAWGTSTSLSASTSPAERTRTAISSGASLTRSSSMRVFVTGGTGHSGSYIIPELIAAGHEVTGLARSDTAAAAVSALGAKVRRGDLQDLDGLMEAAADSDGVIHVARLGTRASRSARSPRPSAAAWACPS